MGTLIANLLTGSFIVERLFAIPGGLACQILCHSITARDYNIIMGVTISLGVFVGPATCSWTGASSTRAREARRVTSILGKDTRYQPLNKASISTDQISPVSY